MINQLQIASRIDLVCPICHVEGECEVHCVEAWQQGNRRDHLRNLLTPYPNIVPQLLQTLLDAYATPEQAFGNCALIAWNDEVPATFLPLFNGTAMIHTQESLQWFALFHREGPNLLNLYTKRILGQLMRSYKMREMIQTLREEEVQMIVPRTVVKRIKPTQPPLDQAPEILISQGGVAADSSAYQEEEWAIDLIRSLT
mgnify:FL=1|jgi:hypothetical protein